VPTTFYTKKQQKWKICTHAKLKHISVAFPNTSHITALTKCMALTLLIAQSIEINLYSAFYKVKTEVLNNKKVYKLGDK